MSHVSSLPRSALRGAALGNCCCSIAAIERAMSRLALLQGYFIPMTIGNQCGEASGVVHLLTGSWTDLQKARDLLSGIAGIEEERHA